jgi:hypothetical protein
LGLYMRYPKYMQYFRRRRESLSQDPNSSKQDLYSYQTGRKKLANQVDCSNHVWMQYPEVRILAGFGKGMLKCCSGSYYVRVKPAICLCIFT